MLSNPEWNYDSIPEIIDGKNIADFIDADIMEACLKIPLHECFAYDAI